MPYYNPTAATTSRSTNYIEYVDSFSMDGMRPKAGVRNFILLFDNFDGINSLETLGKKSHTLYHMVNLYIASGEITLDINNKEVVVKANQVMTTMPENTIRFKAMSDDCKYFMFVSYPKVVSYTFSDLGKNYTSSEFSHSVFLNDCEQERFEYCLEIYKIMKEDLLSMPYEYKLVYQRSWLNVLMVQNFVTHNISTNKTGDANSRQYDVFCRFLEVLNRHVTEHRSVQYYADFLDISSKYLSYVCISYSQKNASTWIDEYVVQKAKVLMSVHHYNITEVSEMLHFQTASSFSRYFKRVTGMTPKDYLIKNK